MANTIFKYPLPFDGRVKMPDGARPLSVHMVRGEAVVYAIVDPSRPMVERRFPIYGTGHPMPDDPGRYLGTFQMNAGALVFHVFDASPQSGRPG